MRLFDRRHSLHRVLLNTCGRFQEQGFLWSHLVEDNTGDGRLSTPMQVQHDLENRQSSTLYRRCPISRSLGLLCLNFRSILGGGLFSDNPRSVCRSTIDTIVSQFDRRLMLYQAGSGFACAPITGKVLIRSNAVDKCIHRGAHHKLRPAGPHSFGDSLSAAHNIE